MIDFGLPEYPDKRFVYKIILINISNIKFAKLSLNHTILWYHISQSNLELSKSAMSVDGKKCRVCLAAQKTSRFNLIFGNNGKIAKQIYEFTGLKVSFFNIF